MSTTWNQAIFHWVDATGRRAQSFISLASQTDAVPVAVKNLATAAQAASDAQIEAVQWQTTFLPTPPAFGSGAYRTVRDVAHLLGTYSSDETSHLLLPGPKAAIFDASHSEVLMSHALIVDLAAKLVAVVGFPGGISQTSLDSGRRQTVSRGRA